jgi:N-acyl-D-amino-acid deacylase
MRTTVALFLTLLLTSVAPAQSAKEGRKLPVTGREVAELRAFDDAMLQFMKERDIPAGTLAVMKGGVLILERGYGHLDREGKRPIPPETPMRLASVVKPITAAAIHKLVREGRLSLEDKPFVLLGVKPPPGKEVDPRLRSITVRHLLEHKGGWDRDKAFDPMFRPVQIANELKRQPPAGPRDVIDYMAGQPLQFDPGSRSCYSNFGYCVLGRVIEKVTGRPYVDYVRTELLAPLSITSIELGHSLPAKRNRREPFYCDPGRGRSLFQLDSTARIPAPDGAFYLEAMDAHGGLIGSAADVARFYSAYWINGEPRKKGQTFKGTFFGSLPGTWTMAHQRADGVVIVALFNQRKDPSGLSYNEIRDVMDRTADGIRNWPTRP